MGGFCWEGFNLAHYGFVTPSPFQAEMLSLWIRHLCGYKRKYGGTVGLLAEYDLSVLHYRLHKELLAHYSFINPKPQPIDRGAHFQGSASKLQICVNPLVQKAVALYTTSITCWGELTDNYSWMTPSACQYTTTVHWLPTPSEFQNLCFCLLILSYWMVCVMTTCILLDGVFHMLSSL